MSAKRAVKVRMWPPPNDKAPKTNGAAPDPGFQSLAAAINHRTDRHSQSTSQHDSLVDSMKSDSGGVVTVSGSSRNTEGHDGEESRPILRTAGKPPLSQNDTNGADSASTPRRHHGKKAIFDVVHPKTSPSGHPDDGQLALPRKRDQDRKPIETTTLRAFSDTGRMIEILFREPKSSTEGSSSPESAKSTARSKLGIFEAASPQQDLQLAPTVTPPKAGNELPEHIWDDANIVSEADSDDHVNDKEAWKRIGADFVRNPGNWVAIGERVEDNSVGAATDSLEDTSAEMDRTTVSRATSAELDDPPDKDSLVVFDLDSTEPEPRYLMVRNPKFKTERQSLQELPFADRSHRRHIPKTSDGCLAEVQGILDKMNRDGSGSEEEYLKLRGLVKVVRGWDESPAPELFTYSPVFVFIYGRTSMRNVMEMAELRHEPRGCEIFCGQCDWQPAHICHWTLKHDAIFPVPEGERRRWQPARVKGWMWRANTFRQLVLMDYHAGPAWKLEPVEIVTETGRLVDGIAFAWRDQHDQIEEIAAEEEKHKDLTCWAWDIDDEESWCLGFNPLKLEDDRIDREW